jgi:CHAT domain-containing protein/Tfp pilus assembly protein PilF
MKRLWLLFLALLCSASALFSQGIETAADELLLNAEYEKLIALVDKTLPAKTSRETAILENKKAEALIRLGKLNEAEPILRRHLASDNDSDYLMGITKSNLGALYINQGRNDLAQETLQEAIAHFERDNQGTSLEAAQAMVYLGQVYKFTGRNEQAEEQLQMALTYRLQKLKEDHELIAASYNDLGLVYFQQDNDKALDFYEKALSIYERLHGKEHPKIAIVNTNIAFVYRDLKLYGDAINNLESSLKIWEKVYSQPHQSKAFVLFNLGETYLKMGDLKAARGYYERALDLYLRSYGPKHPETANVLNAIGNIEITNGQFDEALQHYQRALQANSSNFESNDETENPRVENFYHGNVLLYTLLLKAQALESRHHNKTLRFSDLTTSLATLQKCDTLIDKLRQQTTNEGDKISLGVIATEVYADGVRIAHDASQKAWNKKPLRALAFYFAEKSKSAVLLEAISDADAKSFAGIPAHLLEQEKNLKSAIALTAQKLAQKPSPEEEKYLRETSFNLNRSYEAFVRNLEKDFPGYFNLKFNAASPSIKQLQGLLDDKTLLLSYFVDEKNRRLYVFNISRTKYKITDRAIPEDFEKNITGLRNGIYFNVVQAYTKAATSLSQLLIPSKIPGRIQELVIIPTGRMGVIPFETLLLKKVDSEKTFSALPYLVTDYSVRYEFSAGLLLQKSKQQQTRAASIFLCAPVSFPEKDHLSDLPATAGEVSEIAKLFTAKRINNKLFTGPEANENLVKSKGLKHYTLLHFATHGVVDESNPQLSRIFLQDNSEAEDGNLFAGEIYNLELNADLVTLSACQTGLGKISRGEGVIGLSRALVYAGASNIIVSFWSVADESTANLMKTFYQQLLDNPSKGYAENLRQAKFSLMKNQQYAAPFYWAPFILIGF